jgi:hypothetical protein
MQKKLILLLIFLISRKKKRVNKRDGVWNNGRDREMLRFFVLCFFVLREYYSLKKPKKNYFKGK